MDEHHQKVTKLTLKPDGSCSIDLDNIRSVGIENILDLRAHNMSTVSDRIMQLFEFMDGGSFEITYRSDGKLEIFRGTRVQTEVSPDGTIVVGKHREAAI